MNPSAFYKLAIEQSERTFYRDPNRQMAACQECGGSGTTNKEIKDPTGFPYSVDVVPVVPAKAREKFNL